MKCFLKRPGMIECKVFHAHLSPALQSSFQGKSLFEKQNLCQSRGFFRSVRQYESLGRTLYFAFSKKTFPMPNTCPNYPLPPHIPCVCMWLIHEGAGEQKRPPHMTSFTVCPCSKSLSRVHLLSSELS